MATKNSSIFDKIFRGKNGKVVVWQNPNIPLWGWIVCSALGFVFKHGTVHSGLKHFGEASLFAWAYLEIRSGDSIFRRVLGTAVMINLIYGFFKP